jgi:hypothetical protein
LNDLQDECDDQSPEFRYGCWAVVRSQSCRTFLQSQCFRVSLRRLGLQWWARQDAADAAEKISLAVAECSGPRTSPSDSAIFPLKPVGTSPAETAAFLKQETERWRNVIVADGIKLR